MYSYFVIVLLGLSLFCGSCDDATSCADLDCDDENPCTEDSCNPETVACENEATTLPTECEAAGETGFCALGQCAVMNCAGLVCDDENPCTIDGCFPDIAACVAFVIPNGERCEEGDLFGQCISGTCILEMPPVGDVELAVEVNGFEVDAVTYLMTCGADLTFSGFLTRQGDTWGASLELPAGECLVQLLARDGDGEVACDGSVQIEIVADVTTTLGLVLSCSP